MLWKFQVINFFKIIFEDMGFYGNVLIFWKSHVVIFANLLFTG
jgi:hypothetical protein